MDNSYVFISYAHKDSAAVLPCVEAMKQCGINAWYDEGIEAGSEWPEFIAQKVVDCTKFVLFVSEAYLQSQNCKRELNFAISRKKDILSVYLEDVYLSPGMEMQLGTYQAIYRNRFASADQFHSSFCAEHYFDICRTKPAPKSTPDAASSVSENAAPKATTPPPVQDTFTSSTQSTYSSPVIPQHNTYASGDSFFNASKLNEKNRLLAAVLAFFLGPVGGHWFYLGQKKRGIACVCLFVLCYAIIPFLSVFPVLLALYDCALLIFGSDEKRKKRFKCDFSM